MSHFLWVSKSYWWNIVDKLWTYFMCIHLMRVSHKYDSYNHQIDRIVTGSDVIIDDVTRCWDYRRERPNFSRSVRSISLYKSSCQSHKANVMEFYVTLPDSFTFKWPDVTSMTSYEVNWSWMSLAKWESFCNWESDGNSDFLYQNKNFTYRVQASMVIKNPLIG